MGAGSWTESEDQILRREYVRQGTENTSSTTQWNAIARYLPGRTSRDARKRWVNVLQNQFNKGAWTKSEDDRLRIAVQLYGTRWVTVAKDNARSDEASISIQLLCIRSGLKIRLNSSSEQSPFTAPTGVLSSKCIFRAVHQIASRTNTQSLAATMNDCSPSLRPDLMTPLSDTALWNFQSFPWTPALPDPVGDYDTNSAGSTNSGLYSSQLDILHSSLPSDTNSTYPALFDPRTSEETQDIYSALDEELSTACPSSSASSPQQVSLVIQNPSENLITRMVQQLVTAKVDFKVVQGSN